MTPESPKSPTELAQIRTDFAIDRTIMAANRTLMSWVRSSLSYISFGFTIYKFLQATNLGTQIGPIRTGEPRRLGLLLIGLGVASAIVGTVEYYNTMHQLVTRSHEKINFFRFSALSSILVAALGLFLFISIIAHMEVF